MVRISSAAAFAAVCASCLSGTQGLRHREGAEFPSLKEIFATKPPFGCKKPKDDEQIIYMIVHSEADESNDAGLSEVGKEMAEQIREDPRLQRALSDDPKYRAQAIIMAPNRKCMETAFIAFNESLKDATWDLDPDIKGKGEHNDAVPELGRAMLQQFGASTQLFQKYGEHYDHEHMGTHADRFTRFVSHLKERPERNIVVIATEYEAHLAGAEIGEAEVRCMAVANTKETADKHGWGSFRLLSKPERWSKCSDSVEKQLSGQ